MICMLATTNSRLASSACKAHSFYGEHACLTCQRAVML